MWKLYRSVPPATFTSTLTVVGVSSAANATLDSIYTSPSYIDHHAGSPTPSNNIATKLVGTEIGSFSFYGGATDNTTLVSMPTLSWTGATGGTGTIPAGNDSGIWRSIQCAASGSTESGVQATITIGTGVSKLRVYGTGIDWNGNTGVKCRVTLQDGSGLTSVQTGAGSGGANTAYDFEWTLNANAAGQTALIQLFPATLTVGGPAIGYGAIVLGT